MANTFDLLKKCSSPLYVYDYAVLKDRCKSIKDFSETIQQGLPEGIAVNMHYSTKSNNNLTILSIIEQAGLSVDCMSPYEFECDKAAGFTLDRIVYVCNNIAPEEMQFVYDAGVLICLDSISQVESWGKLFPGTDIMIRINPGVSGIGFSEKVTTSGKKTKFGISEENLPSLKQILKDYNLNVIGTHQHLGTSFLDDKIPTYIAGVKAGLAIVDKHFPNVQIVDLGGGFGVPYLPEEEPLDLSILAEELIPVLNKFAANHDALKELKFEPGRYIPCESGKVLGYVTAVKNENGIWWIGTDIGMNQIVRPSMYKEAYHDIGFIYKDKDKKRPEIVANICGNICESGDILGEDRTIELPDIGDIVVIHNAGAYGYSMASNYTGRARPAEVLIDHNDIRIIRSREKLSPKMEDIIVNL